MLLPPLVQKIRERVKTWRDNSYKGASETSKALLNWWFKTPHLREQTDGTMGEFQYYRPTRSTRNHHLLYDVVKVKDEVDMIRFDSSVSTGMFDEDWRRQQGHRENKMSLQSRGVSFTNYMSRIPNSRATSSLLPPISLCLIDSTTIFRDYAFSLKTPCCPITALRGTIGETIFNSPVPPAISFSPISTASIPAIDPHLHPMMKTVWTTS